MARQNPFDEFLAELQGKKTKSPSEDMSKPESKTRRGRQKPKTTARPILGLKPSSGRRPMPCEVAWTPPSISTWCWD